MWPQMSRQPVQLSSDLSEVVNYIFACIIYDKLRLPKEMLEAINAALYEGSGR